MASNADLNALRAKVRQEHRRATAKASRLRSKGVEVNGTQYDPRRNLANVKKYNRKQLEAYSSQLNSFNDRRNTFEAGHEGVILPGADVRQYRQTASRLRRVARREYNKVADLPAFDRGMTVREADRLDRPSQRARMGGMAVMRPYDMIERKLSNVTGPEALRRLTAQMEGKLAKGYRKSTLADQRQQLMDMLTTIGHIESVNAARELTDDQFNVLFNYNTHILNEISMDYEFIKLRSAGTEEEFQSKIHEKAGERISNAIKWAKQLDF